MMISLGFGKSVEMTSEQYFSMSDNELAYLFSLDQGDYVQNPFHGSVLTAKSNTRKKLDNLDAEDECDEEDVYAFRDLTEIDAYEKFEALDTDYQDD